MNTNDPSHSARRILFVVTALALASGVSAQTAPQHQIPAQKMLYPQREYSDWQNYPVRTVQDISPAPKAVRLDRFGGRVDRQFTKTGFYHTRKIDGRWWFIDPDGHPYLNAAVASVSEANSPASTAAFAKTFSTKAEWVSKTRELLVSNGFNGAGAWSDVGLVRNAPEQSSRPLSYAVNLEIMNAYGAKHGGTYNVPGTRDTPKTPSSFSIRPLKHSPTSMSPPKSLTIAKTPISSATSPTTKFLCCAPIWMDFSAFRRPTRGARLPSSG